MQDKIAENVALVCGAPVGHDSIKSMHATNHPASSAEASTPQLTTTTFNPWQRLLVLAGLLVGFALRLFHLGSESLWYDETVSVVLARKSIPALIAHTTGDIHPPGYYLLLHGWQTLVHPTLDHGLEFLFAWPSLFFGLLIVALIWAIGRQLLDPTTTLIGLWLAAINPFHIWYSQEVRMYTLGALLGLLCLWALLKWQQQTRKNTHHAGRRWLALYAVAGALGLYTLYYFLFALFALNVIALLELIVIHRRTNRASWRWGWQWLLAQLALLLLWSPWLGIFWHQAVTPPVPPWRVNWATAAAFYAAVGESFSALISGQSAPNPTSAQWLVVMAILLLFVQLGAAKQKGAHTALRQLLLFVFLPVVLLVGITYFVTPLYHVRYLFTYAAPFQLLVAAAIMAVGRRQRSLGAVLLLALLAINGLSLQRFWFAAEYRSDDHRAAVAQLAKSWRPGDLILVNAGWAYTALETYWPTTLTGVDGALPPPLGESARLHDYAQEVAQTPDTLQQRPLLVRTGSIDGPATLGWGDPKSDFFALDRATTAAALHTLSQAHARTWHYRLYDTVSDPKGQIRNWLATNSKLLLDQAIPGRDYLALQLYQNNQARLSEPAITSMRQSPAYFGGFLQLQAMQSTPPTVAAGSTLYLQSRWLRQEIATPLPTTSLPLVVSFSLRLYDTNGLRLAQQDETPITAVMQWSMTAPTDWTLALPIAVDTPPGTYQLQLLVYDQAGEPLPVEDGENMLALGDVTVTTATTAPIVNQRLARFDYIDLVQATVTPVTTVDAGIHVTYVWLPQPSAYRDTYLARLTLRDEAGHSIQTREVALGGWHYPSGIWTPLVPVRHDQQLLLPAMATPGRYHLTLQVLRQSDGTPIAAATNWWQRTTEWSLGTITIE